MRTAPNTDRDPSITTFFVNRACPFTNVRDLIVASRVTSRPFVEISLAVITFVVILLVVRLSPAISPTAFILDD